MLDKDPARSKGIKTSYWQTYTRNVVNFLADFETGVKDCDFIPEILAKFRENFTEKSAISFRFQMVSAKF